MAKQKKSTAKRTTRSTGTPKSRKKTSSHSKLDPLLSLGARRAPKEKAAARKAFAESMSPEAPAGLEANLRKIPLGIHGLGVQMAAASLTRFVSDDLVPVLIDTADQPVVAAKIKSWKGKCHAVTQRTLRARVPRSRLASLARLAKVDYVEASTQLKPHCDLAHLSAQLNEGNVRTVPQTGRGVLVGIVDTGIDAAHPAFKKANRTRIVRYIDQSSDGADVEFSAADIEAGNASASPDHVGHGTHVAGIAAGNGQGSAGGRHAGVAPEADLAIVKTSFMSDDIADGVRRIFEIADERGQPCVVNLSLGGHVGGHDGTTITERSIDQLSGAGRIVVVSAGNEGDSQIHAGTVLPQGSAVPERWTADFHIKERMLQGQRVGIARVQVWHQREDDLKVRLRSPIGQSFQAPKEGTKEFDLGFMFVEAVHQIAAYNGDHSTTFFIATIASSQNLKGWSVVVEEDRGPGKKGVQVGPVHAWIQAEDMGEFVSGSTRSHLVGMPGTAFSAITVASYATRKTWKSRDSANPTVTLDSVNLEDISYFSSPGPTRDGHNKPEIAAPGQWLISALSSDSPLSEIPEWLRIPSIPYAAMQGTSMSAPYVTGTIALLLEKDAGLDEAEVKRRLMKSASQDPFTKPCWNARWGYGRLDLERLLTIEP